MVTEIDAATHDQVMKEFLELNDRYEYLIWTPVEDGYCITGTIYTSASYNDINLMIKYPVKIDVPKDYPRSIPVCYDVENKIDPHYHQYQNGVLCLGVDTNQYLKFRFNQSLLGFVNDLLVPYLYGYEYYLKYGIAAPWSEERHNALGLIDYYIEYFENVNRITQILYLLVYTLTSRNVYLPNNPCPCGSRKHIRLCHKDKVLKLRKLCIASLLLRDVLTIMDYLQSEPMMIYDDEASKVIILKSFIDELQFPDKE